MTFLKKLGLALLKGLNIATEVGPAALPFFGSGKAGKFAITAVSDLSLIGGVVTQVEVAMAAVPNSTGAQKLQAALPLVTNIIQTSELIVGKKVHDEALFTKACTEFTQATVDLLNSIDQNEVKTS